MDSARSRLALMYIALAAIVFMPGCAYQRSTPYPSDWPRLITGTQCGQLSGRFANQPVATARHGRVDATAPERGYLSVLLQQGTLGSYDNLQASIDSVRIDTDSKTVWLYSTAPTVETAALDRDWVCLSSGELTRTFNQKVESEASILDDVTLHVTLASTEAGSLVAHIVVNRKNVFSFEDSRWEIWALFERLTSQP